MFYIFMQPASVHGVLISNVLVYHNMSLGLIHATVKKISCVYKVVFLSKDNGKPMNGISSGIFYLANWNWPQTVGPIYV